MEVADKRKIFATMVERKAESQAKRKRALQLLDERDAIRRRLKEIDELVGQKNQASNASGMRLKLVNPYTLS